MSQRIVRRLLGAGAVAAVLAAGPVQAQEGPRETGTFWRWLGSVQKQVVLALRLRTGESVPRKAGPMIDPNGTPAASTCQSCTEQGHMIDPNG